MNTGVVKFFNQTKGFGFIIDDKDGKEQFVHSSGLVDSINQNDKVTFELEKGKKGMNCTNVRKA